MDADLMGPAGFEPAFYQRRVTQDVEALPMSNGALAPAALDDRDSLAVRRRARERRVDTPWLALGTPETIAR